MLSPRKLDEVVVTTEQALRIKELNEQYAELRVEHKNLTNQVATLKYSAKKAVQQKIADIDSKLQTINSELKSLPASNLIDPSVILEGFATELKRFEDKAIADKAAALKKLEEDGYDEYYRFQQIVEANMHLKLVAYLHKMLDDDLTVRKLYAVLANKKSAEQNWLIEQIGRGCSTNRMSNAVDEVQLGCVKELLGAWGNSPYNWIIEIECAWPGICAYQALNA